MFNNNLKKKKKNFLYYSIDLVIKNYYKFKIFKLYFFEEGMYDY